MQLVYVGPHDEVEVDGHPEDVQAYTPVEIDDQLAGRPPHGHRADEDYDPGEGLLAQPSNWRTVEDYLAEVQVQVPVQKPAKKKRASKKAAATPPPAVEPQPDPLVDDERRDDHEDADGQDDDVTGETL